MDKGYQQQVKALDEVRASKTGKRRPKGAAARVAQLCPSDAPEPLTFSQQFGLRLELLAPAACLKSSLGPPSCPGSDSNLKARHWS